MQSIQVRDWLFVSICPSHSIHFWFISGYYFRFLYYSGQLNVQELTLGPAASTCSSTALPGVAIECDFPTGAVAGAKYNFVVVADRSTGAYRSVRFDAMPAGSDLAITRANCLASAAGGTGAKGWGTSDVQQNIASTLLLAANMKAVSSLKPLVDLFFDKDFSVANPKSKYSRSFDYLGFPLGTSIAKRQYT